MWTYGVLVIASYFFLLMTAPWVQLSPQAPAGLSVCSGIGESGEYLLRAMALATNGTSFFLTDDSGIGHTHLKPTTDSLKVEHLNDMLVRTIVEFSYMPDCTGHWHEEQIEQLEEQFIPNPFSQQEIAQDPSIPHGPTTLYLLDVTGKLIRIYNGILYSWQICDMASSSFLLYSVPYSVGWEI